MTQTLKDCDLIMKGGVTSGVVYPEAIATIGRQYRLHGVGGTSAGAIAAAFAVAAEFRRQETGSEQGFAKVAESAGYLGQNMAGLFQPRPDLARLYRFLIGMNAVRPRNRYLRVLWALVRAYGPWALVAAGVTLAVAGGVGWLAGGHLWPGLGPALPALGLAVIFAILAAAKAALRDVAVRLPLADWGLCPGIRQTGGTGPAFGEWIADSIHEIAGRRDTNDPLTVEEIERHGIHIGAMTTDITSHRPYELPMFTDEHYFSPAEFRRIMPEPIVDFMEKRSAAYAGPAAGRPDDLRKLPERGLFPVFLVARMSLSFPGLIASVPLYRLEKGPDGADKAVRCLFTDGGLSSNFPIHFFDSILPGRPTFGIALGDADERAGDAPAARVHIAGNGKPDLPLPSEPLDGLAKFGWALLGTAKDWQDTLQSRLPGYRERTVTILLKPNEGGLNLNMGQDAITRLAAYGAEAATTLTGAFDFDRHRALRATVAMPKVEDMLKEVKKKLEGSPAGATSYPDLLQGPPPAEFQGAVPDDWPRLKLLPFMVNLAAAAGEIGQPVFDTVLASVRLRANAGRRPPDLKAAGQPVSESPSAAAT